MTGGAIDYDAIPGNTHLVDLSGDVFTRHSEAQREIVLIPTPSDDPEDPLNWTPRRKWLSVFCTVVYIFGVGVPGAALYSILTNISEKTGITIAQLNSGTGYMFLFFGLGCLIFQPLALQYGKRPVYLFSLLATCLISVWVPYCTSNSEWIGSKILQGLVGAPIESLCEISISDVFFEHERARGMGVYAIALLTSNFLAPMIAGFITNGMPWDWVMFFSAIWAAVAFFILVFFMEETNYDRKLSAKKLAENLASDGEGKDGAVVNVTENNIGTVLSGHMGEANEVFSTDSDFVPKPTKTFWQKMSLTGGFRDKFLLPHFFLGPFKMAMFPSVLWGGFLYGSSLIWFNLLNATEAVILSSPPYNFSPAMCGLAYISPTIFSVVLYFFSGYLSDWVKIRVAKSRGGKSLPEDRLWVLIFYMIFGFLASIGWGVGAYYEVHWMLLVISLGMLGGLGIFGIIGGCTYCSDCYHEMETEGMVVVIVIRNCMSFGVSYGLTAWVDNMGLKNAFIVSASVLFLTNLSFVVMRYTGPWWRNKTKGLYWRIVEHNRKVLSGKDL